MSVTVTDDVFRFGGFTLDLRKGTIAQNDEPVFLRPKAFTLLTHLARNMGRIVPKAELMEVAWPGVYVTEDSLTQSIREFSIAACPRHSILRKICRQRWPNTGR